MISYIKGPLVDIWEDTIVVEAGNIGYRIFVPQSVLETLPGTGSQVTIYTHFQVRDDGMNLYGFLNRQDLAMFRMLIGVNGIGPKGALGILSVLRPDELRLAIVSADAKAISRAPGVGSKTAQRVILDLKDKIKHEDLLPGGFIPEIQTTWKSAMDGAAQEAVDALAALGYSVAEAVRAVQKVEITEGMKVEAVLKASLKHLA